MGAECRFRDRRNHQPHRADCENRENDGAVKRCVGRIVVFASRAGPLACGGYPIRLFLRLRLFDASENA